MKAVAPRLLQLEDDLFAITTAARVVPQALGEAAADGPKVLLLEQGPNVVRLSELQIGLLIDVLFEAGGFDGPGEGERAPRLHVTS